MMVLVFHIKQSIGISIAGDSAFLPCAFLPIWCNDALACLSSASVVLAKDRQFLP